jgi:uncharacterized protein (TIGR02757 family)
MDPFFNPDTDDIKSLLDEKVIRYNKPEFIGTDPIQVPKQFSQKENIEISAFITSTISWGNRTAIIKNALRLMNIMDNDPYQFIINASDSDYRLLKSFVHRTFNGDDCIYFAKSLKNIYANYGGLQSVFEKGFNKSGNIKDTLIHFYSIFFEIPGERTRKHISNVNRGASGKRLNMFLRWMVRKDSKNVDFGLWNNIPSSALMLPLDVHTGNISRGLGLLKRKQNDWQAVEEVTNVLRLFDPDDPVKYDFALFGMGAFEKFQDGKKQLFSI